MSARVAFLGHPKRQQYTHCRLVRNHSFAPGGFRLGRAERRSAGGGTAGPYFEVRQWRQIVAHGGGRGGTALQARVSGRQIVAHGESRGMEKLSRLLFEPRQGRQSPPVKLQNAD
jgi:hypothetical protein